MGARIGRDIMKYLEANTSREGGHRLWLGYKDKDGYGSLHFQGKQVSVHRLAAHLFLGLDLSSKVIVCHIRECRHRNCWEPTHLYAGDAISNTLDKAAVRGSQ